MTEKNSATSKRKAMNIRKYFKIGSNGFCSIIGLIVGISIGLHISDFTLSPLLIATSVIGLVLGRFYAIKNKKFVFKKIYQRVGIYPFVGSLLYFIWLSYLLVSSGIWFHDNELLNLIFVNRSSPSNFIISYAASSLDSFVFFVLVGFVFALITLKKPQEESFSTKVEYIFPESKDVPLNNYLQEKISALACISPITERTITIQEISDCRKFVKVLIKSHSVIKNIHNNREYINKDAKFNLGCTKPFVGKEILGEALDVSVIYRIDGTEHTKHIINDVVKLTQNDPYFSCIFSIKLDSEQQAIYQTSGWFWQALDTEDNKNMPVSGATDTAGLKYDTALRFSVIRYTTKQDFKVINNCSETVRIVAKLPTKVDFEEELRPSVATQAPFCKFSAESLTPEERVSIYFKVDEGPAKNQPKLAENCSVS